MKAWENGGLSSVAGGKGNRGDHSEAPVFGSCYGCRAQHSPRHVEGTQRRAGN